MSDKAKSPAIKMPHCPECKTPEIKMSSSVTPAMADGTVLIRFATWCSDCGCLLGILTMPGTAMPGGQSEEPSPFGGRGPRIVGPGGQPA
jgi:hypothetical protein